MIKKAIITILISFMMFFVSNLEVEADIIKINDFAIDVKNEIASPKTTLILNWNMDFELSELKIYIILSNGQKELSYVYSCTSGRDNLGEFIISENENQTYHYYLNFEIDIVRIGDFQIEMEYNVNGSWYEYRNYVISKGEIIDKNFFTVNKAIIVGIIIVIFSSIGVLLIFEASKNEYELNEDNVAVAKKNKKTEE